jgi:hypothetical protein
VAQNNYTGTKNRSKQQRTTTTPFYLSKVLLETFPFFVRLKITPAAALERTCGVQKADASINTTTRVFSESNWKVKHSQPHHHTTQVKAKMSTCTTCLDFGVLNVPGGFTGGRKIVTCRPSCRCSSFNLS